MDAIHVAANEQEPNIFADGDQSTWGERLLLNLLSYSLIVIPIGIVVLSTRYKLLPKSLQCSSLVQWFVFGSSISNGRHQSKIVNDDDSIEDSKVLLVEESKPSDKEDSTQDSNYKIEFIFSLFGLQLSYLIWGFLQEKIMTTKYQVTPKPMHLDTDDSGKSFIVFHDSQFLVLINRIVAFISAILALVYTSHRASQSMLGPYSHIYRHQQQKLSSKPRAPLYEYIYSSLSNILSSWCQYEALKFVNFPTQCLSKSCKIIPVMLMSKLLLKKKYQLSDYACAALLAAGMFIFLINQPVINKHNPKDSPIKKAEIPETNSTSDHKLIRDRFKELTDRVSVRNTLTSGLIILALYLTFDSFTSNWQQSLYTRYQISNWQMMAATNFYSILLTLTSLHQLGNLTPAFKLLGRSSQLLRDCMLMSIMSSVGQMFVYYTIKRFGSVIFTVIMTLRQFLSILLSCAIYGHALTFGSTMGLLLVFGVAGYQISLKMKK